MGGGMPTEQSKQQVAVICCWWCNTENAGGDNNEHFHALGQTGTGNGETYWVTMEEIANKQ